VLRNIYANANSFQRAIVNDGSTDATNVPNFIVWSHDALGDIISRSLDKHSLRQRCHTRDLVEDECQVFLRARALGPDQGSVCEKVHATSSRNLSRGKNPTAYMAEALPFFEIELASLQLLGTFPEPFFGALAVLDIDTRSVPLDNLSTLVTQGDFVVQHPAILAISPPHACFMQKRLAG
jgi:hypothetical protein